jgi:hypothetical protein
MFSMFLLFIYLDFIFYIIIYHNLNITQVVFVFKHSLIMSLLSFKKPIYGGRENIAM